ncbi:hypothetical protein D3C73_1394060 [compost metagenome]
MQGMQQVHEIPHDFTCGEQLVCPQPAYGFLHEMHQLLLCQLGFIPVMKGMYIPQLLQQHQNFLVG